MFRENAYKNDGRLSNILFTSQCRKQKILPTVKSVSRIAAFIKLFEYRGGDAVGGDGQRLLICSVIGELDFSVAVGRVCREVIPALYAAQGEGVLLAAVDDNENDLSFRSQERGGVCAEAYIVFKLFAAH